LTISDKLKKASEKGKCTLFKAVGLRKDDVHRRLHDEIDSLELIPTDRIQYHRSYYKSYTSKINLEKFEPVQRDHLVCYL
jgi:predicted dehydrogenase